NVRTLVDHAKTEEWKSISLESIDWSGEIQVFRKRLRKDYRARFHDGYADETTADFLSLYPSVSTLRLSQKFLLLLEEWKREVEASNRTFTVLVLPRQIDDAMATKLFIGKFGGNVVQSRVHFENCEKCFFQNDAHWNEYGNEKMAEFISSNRQFPFK